MKTLEGEKFRTVLELPDGIKIQVNLYNWILLIPPRNYSYFSTFESLFNDLLDYKIKIYAIQTERKNVRSLSNSIETARKEIMEIVESLMTLKDSNRLA